MTPLEHYEEAEKLLKFIENNRWSGKVSSSDYQLAQIHAMLACASDSIGQIISSRKYSNPPGGWIDGKVIKHNDSI